MRPPAAVPGREALAAAAGGGNANPHDCTELLVPAAAGAVGAVVGRVVIAEEPGVPGRGVH